MCMIDSSRRRRAEHVRGGVNRRRWRRKTRRKENALINYDSGGSQKWITKAWDPGLWAGLHRDKWRAFLNMWMYFVFHIIREGSNSCRSQWPRGLRRVSAVVVLLALWFRIPSWAWMSLCCECCVVSGRGLSDELITRPEESYRLWCVVVCDLET
jgi:hypothetical protein